VTTYDAFGSPILARPPPGQQPWLQTTTGVSAGCCAAMPHGVSYMYIVFHKLHRSRGCPCVHGCWGGEMMVGLVVWVHGCLVRAKLGQGSQW
jgi:hypothetical protein